MNQKQKEILQFSLLALVAICLRYPLIALGTKTFFDVDWAIFCEPVAQYNKASLLSGHLPSWCPLLQNGTPYLAQWNTMVCYPGILIYLLLPVHWGLNLFQLLHVAWGGIGMYLLARKLNRGHHLGASILGLSYELNGVCLSLLNWPQNLSNYSWIPWVILLQTKAMQEGGRWLAWAGLASGMHLLTGLPEFNLITWTFGLAVGCTEGFNEVKPIRALSRWVASIGLSIAVAALQLFPSAVLIATNGDAHRGMANSGWALGGSGLINFIHPAYDTVNLGFADRPSDQIWMTVHYTNLGLTALALVMAWKYRRMKLAAAVVLVSSLWTILAGGWKDPLIGPIIEHLPVISRIRYPIKFVLATLLGLHLLACLYWRGEKRTNTYPSYFLVLALPLAALALALLFRVLAQAPNPGTHPARLVLHTLCGLGVLAIVFHTQGCWKQHARAAAVGTILLLNTWAASREPNPMVQTTSYAGNPIRQHCESRQLVLPAPYEGRLYSARMPRKRGSTAEEEVEILGLRGQGNAFLPADLSKLDGFTSLGPHWQEVWLREIDGDYMTPERAQELRHMLDFCGVQLITQENAYTWARRTNAMPLFSIGQRPVLEADPNQAILRFQAGSFDPRHTVLLEAATAAQADPAAKATLAHWEPERWVIQAEATRPTLLVIAQTWYPGWMARVNGKPAEILKANVAFQALVVPPGKSQVELRYQEPGLAAGLTLSVLSTVGCLTAIVRARSQRNSQLISPS